MVRTRLAALGAWVTCVLLGTASPWADQVIKRRVTADLLLMPKKQGSEGKTCAVSVDHPRTSEVVTIYLGANRVRRDQPGLSVILRRDQGKIYFLYPADKMYSEFPYPVPYQRYASGWFKTLGPEMRRFRLDAQAPPETTTVGQWSVTRYSASAVNDLRTRFRILIAMSNDRLTDDTLVLDLQKVLNELRFGGEGWADLLPVKKGLPLVWEEAERQPETEVVYREEVQEMEARDVPADLYDLPGGYKKIDFDLPCIELR